ncbi:MAG: flagellar motor switch protein FliG [Chloroflexi bacterium]|nr:flagellar motor switch protein FliG [Chloroflexota bacterium]
MTAAAPTGGALPGRAKAAAMLALLPPADAAVVLRHLPETLIERATLGLLQYEPLAPAAQQAVLREAHALVHAEDLLRQGHGGEAHARDVLTQALGGERAADLLERLLATLRAGPFHYLGDLEPARLVTYLEPEHPQVIALILSHLGAAQAAAVLALLPAGLQPEVSLRLARMDAVAPVVVARIDALLRKKLATVVGHDALPTGGVDFLVRVLKQVNRGAEHAILEDLGERDPDLATDIKQRMFVFENLTLLDNRSLQRVLREVSSQDLVLALRGAPEALRAHVFTNLSQRAAATLREDLETSPPVRLRLIEEAQQQVVAVARRLEEADEIVIVRNDAEALV